TVSNGPCAAPTTDQVVITVYPGSQPSAMAGPDQSICLPTTSVTLAGNSPTFPATGTWTLVSGSGSITNPGTSNSSVTGLAVGQNVFQWTISNGPCIPSTTSDQVSIFVYDNTQPAANAGADKNFCEPVSSATLAANPVIFPATGQWTLISGTGSIFNPNSATTQVNGLSQGENIFQWTISNGPCPGSTTTDQISIFIYDKDQMPANAGTDQFLCTPASTATMSANSATFPATGAWTLISGSGIISTPTSPTTGITGLAIGENIFRWTITNGPCSNSITTDDISIFVYDSGAPAADAGPTQSICSPANSVTMVANAAVFPGIGTWELVSGTGIIQSPNSPSSLITNLGLGENVFRWTVNNGLCGSATTQSLVSIFVYSEFSPSAVAGIDQDLCTPQVNTFLQGSIPIFPSTGLWTLLSGVGTIVDPTNPNTEVTNLGIGPNVFRWTVLNGPCANGTTSDDVTITIYNGGAAAPFAGNDQELCSPTSSTLLVADPAEFPGVGTWSVINGTGTFSDPNDPSATVTGLSIGINILKWNVNYSTCGSPSDVVSIIVYDSSQGASDAGQDQFLCNNVASTTMTAEPVIAPGSGTWSLISGSAAIADVNNPSSGIGNLAVGANVFVWTIYNGNCLSPTLTTDTVVIYVFDGNVLPANAGADQSFCSPVSSATVTGNTLTYPQTGLWELIQGTGVIVNPTSATTVITGLSVGENIFRWTTDNGPCLNSITSDLVSIFIYDQNQLPANAGSDQSFCTPVSTTTMQGNTITFPAIGTWTLHSGTGVIADTNNPSSSVSGLSIGENIFQWQVENGPCGSPTTDIVSIFIYDENNPLADAGSDQEMCLPQNSTSMQGSTYVFPATGTWTLIQGFATIQNINDPNSGITNLGAGENIFVWTISNGPCAHTPTTDTIAIRVYEPDAAPADAGADQSLCTPSSQAVMTAAVPDNPGFGTWTIVSGAAIIVDPNDPNTLITGLQQGETVLEWTVYNGPCNNSNTTDLISIFIYDNTQPAANAGPDQDLCTPVTSTIISANSPIFPAIGYWTLISGQGDISDPNNPTTTVSNLGVGANVFQWTIENGPCDPQLTTDDLVIYLFDNTQSAANAGVDQEFCLPVTNATLEGSHLVGASTGMWTVFSGGGTIVAPDQEQTLVTDLPVGENIFVWEVNNGSCGTTTDTTSIFIFDPSAAEADAGPDTSFCTPVSTYTMLANTPAAPGVGTWQLVSGNGTIAEFHSATSDISGLTIGENIFTWSIYNGPCEPPTIDSVSIFIFDENLLPADAGSDQEICLPLNMVTMTANVPVFPATGTWTLLSGTGTITDVSDPATTITNLTAGENIFVWTFENGPCAESVTTDTVSITVYAPDALIADAGADQSLCTPAGSTFLSAATPTIPGLGTWSVIAGTGVFVNPNDPNSEVTGLSVGQNIFEWIVYNGPCAVTNTTDQVSIFLYDANQQDADAGPNQDFCTPITTAQMSANSIIFPASGTWTISQGAGSIVNPNDPTTLVTDLAPGVNILTWTVNNGPCANGITTDTVELSIFNNDQSDANAGADQELCLPVNSTLLQSNQLTGAATGTWTLFSGGGDIADANSEITAVTNLPVGINVFVWTQENGPCGSTSDTVSVSVFDPGAAVADAGPDVSFCTPTSTYTMAANTPAIPGVGTWALVSGTGSIAFVNSPSTIISGLTIGENVFSWTIYNGPCAQPTVDFVSIFIFDENLPEANAGSDQEICLPQNSTTMTANTPVFPAEGQWTLFSGTGTISDNSDPATSVTGLGVGVNTFVWTFNNGPCNNAITTDTVSILVFDPIAAVADAGGDQYLCTPITTTALTATTPDVPGFGTWTVVNGTGIFANVNDPNTTVTNLSVGENIFRWVVYNGPCSVTNTEDLVSVFVFDANQSVADAGPDQDFCTPVSVVQLDGNELTFPAAGYWSVVQGSVVFNDTSDPNTIITNVTPGVNILAWTVDNGVCPNGTTTDNVVISIFDANQSPADAGADQELCLPATSALLQANPLIAAATGQWTLIAGGGTIVDPTNESTTVSNLPVGINTFVWTLNNGPCSTTADTVSVIVFDPAAPAANAGSDVSYCTPVSIHTMAANFPAIPGTGTWALISGTGSLSDVNSATAVVSGLTVGQNIFSWTIYNGPCAAPTVDLVSIFIYDQNMPSANAGADQELCAPASTTTMTGNSPVFPGTGQWSLVAGTGIIADPSSPSSAVSGLSIGTNVFVWSFDNGPCPGAITTDTMEVRIYDPNAPAANAGIDQFLCTPTSSTALTALVPTIPGVGTWVVVNGTGTFADIHDPSTVVTNLSVGQNTFQWTVYNGPCANTNTTDLVSIFLYDATQATSNAGPDQQLCTPNTTTQLAGNSIIFPATGTWSIAQGSATFSDINDPNAVISNVAPGVNIFTWTVNNGPCANNITTDNVTVSVYNNNQSIADAGSDQELCLPTTGTTLQANQLTAAATGIWSLLSGGGTIADPTSEFTAISNLPVGINVFVWSLDNGPCGISSDTVSVAVYDPASPPANAGEDAFYCTPVSTHTMSGSVPLYPAEGTWTLITGSGIIQDIHDPNSLITGLTVGENIFIWSVYNGPCGPVTLDVMSIFIYNENTPNADAGEDFEICLPQNSVDMMASPAEFPAIGVWTLVQGGGTINDVNSPNSTMANLPVGTNIFIWTVDNGPCANGITSDTVEVRVFDPGIALPNAGPDQNICTPASTTVMGAEQVNDPNFGTWELIGGSGVIGNVNDPGTIISGLAVGVNTFTWTVYNGSCENSLMTDTMVVNVFDEGQLPADAGADQELCFPQTSTQLSANHAIVPAEGTWIVIEGSGIFADIHDENTMVSGLSIGNNTFQWTIDNGPCMNAVTTDLVTISIFDPEAVNAQAGADMEICTPQDCVQMGATTPADPQIGTWSVVSAINGNGAIPFGSFNDVNDPNAQLCALSVGVHTLQWELYNGPCLNNTTDIVIVSVFDETAPPANAGTDQELCGGNNQTQLTANTPVFPAVGTWNILSAPGNPVIADTNDPLSPITNLQIGITTLTWSIYNGPCNEATSDTVVVVVFDPQSPDANAGPDQNFCENFPDTPMAANTPISPAVGTWTTISGGGTFSNPNDPSAMVSDIPLNENIYVWTIYNGACNNGVTSDTISVYVNDLTVAAANAGDDVVFCGAPDSLQLHGSVTTGLATSLWTIIQGGGDIQNVLNNNPYMFEIPNGINIYEYTVDNGLCGISSDEVIVTIYDPELPSADAGTGDMICENEFTSFNLMANAVSPPAMGWWSVLEGPIEISDSTDAKAIVTSLGHILTELVNVPSTLVWTIDNGTCGSSSDSVTYILEDCLSIKIPDAFSPNGDGVNDFWIIPNITNYPHNSVKIFNRWGAEVYSAAPYKNEWDGISIHPATLGEGLPVSTYYYILDLGTGSSENYTGFVYLKR
ncbi:MAG: gliding motility-associated C-terminal domain-containing protein, partial [Crocinitomicaceae bacterium]|nr:gliding motility-associated C-terminal domain-containing protein [Crocinitomicaceae bacterium]